MDTLSDTWFELFGLAGCLNPLTILIAAWMGWRADAVNKILIAAFAAAVLSLLIETALMLIGVPPVFAHDAGALAVMPFRLFTGGVVASLAYLIARKRRG